MVEGLLLVVVVLLILGFFYKQSAVHEFRINQGNVPMQKGVGVGGVGVGGEEKGETLADLWKERVPLVIRGLPRLSLWTASDVAERVCYDRVPLFQGGMTVREWMALNLASVEVCPWQGRVDQAEALARVSGISIWCRTHLHSLLDPWGSFLRLVRYQAWAGNMGVRRTYASWTCILPAEGDIVVTVFPETMEPYLPAEWRGGFPGGWTRKDTPFAGDIKYMDVVVRAGTCFFLPPHWYVSWSSTGKVMPMVFTVLYHSPVSWLAEKLSK